MQHFCKVLRRKPWSQGTSQGSGNIGSKSVEFVVGSDAIVTLTHSLTQKDSIVAYEAVSYKNTATEEKSSDAKLVIENLITLNLDISENQYSTRRHVQQSLNPDLRNGAVFK